MKKILFILCFFTAISLQAQSIKSNTSTQLIGSGTVWDDIVVPAGQTRVNPATSLPAYSADSLSLLFVADTDSNEIAFYSMQLPHRIKYGPAVICSPHVHWMQYAAGDTTWDLRLVYRVHKLGGTSGAWTYLTTYKMASLTYGTAPFHQIAEFPDIILNNVSESSYIDFKLYRFSATGVATVYVKGFDIHYEIEKLGTDGEYPSH